MKDEIIKVMVTESGQAMDVVVLNKRADRIQVVVGKGIHNVQCNMTPTRNGQAYVGNIMGREIVYQRSQKEVQADIDHAHREIKQTRNF